MVVSEQEITRKYANFNKGASSIVSVAEYAYIRAVFQDTVCLCNLRRGKRILSASEETRCWPVKHSRLFVSANGIRSMSPEFMVHTKVLA